MQKFTRSVGLGLAAIGAAAAMALSTATSAGAANVALMVNGMGAGTLNYLEMASVLGGMFGGYDRINVPWPQQARPLTGKDDLLFAESINIGADNLDAAITSALAQLKPGEHVTVVGLSAGSLVVDEELKRLLADPTAPDKSKLNFVVAADASRMGHTNGRFYGILDYTYHAPVETKYDVTAMAAEYDGWADFPDRPNLLARMNARAGTLFEHVPAMVTDLSTVPSSNITIKTNDLGGVTTSYLVPAKGLPLVRMIPFLKPREAVLKKKIDAAYTRNDNKVSAAAAARAAAPTADRGHKRRAGQTRAANQ